jgi:ABC-type glycerol-3-phosphate transport system substrate-binding protein
MYKKILTVLIAFILTVSLIAGCSQEKPSAEPEVKATNTPSATEEASVPSVPSVTWEDAPQIRMVVRGSTGIDEALAKTEDDIEDNLYTRYIFEKTGVRLIPVVYPNQLEDFKTKLAVEIASGAQIDLLKFNSLQQDWLEAGISIRINDILEQYKSITPNIENNITPEGWEGVSKKGDIYGFPTRPGLGNPSVSGVFIRKDWLDKVGLPMPKSTDDITKIMQAFTHEDPDGNGKNDTFGMGLKKNFSGIHMGLYLWGVNVYSDEWVDGKLINQAFSDRARHAYSTYAQWFAEGLIDKEGIIDTHAKSRAIINGKIGLAIETGGSMLNLQSDMEKNGMSDKFVMVETPIVSSFDNKTYGFRATENISDAVMITPIAKDYESIMKLMDFMYSEEGTKFQEFGLLDREHKVVDGKQEIDVAYSMDNKSYLDVFNLGKSYNHISSEAYTFSYGESDLAKKIIEKTVNDYYNLHTHYLRIIYDYPQNPAWNKYPDYRKGIGSGAAPAGLVSKFYLGEWDPMNDEHWNNFMTEVNKYGMDKLYAEIQDEYEKDPNKQEPR